MKNKAHITSEGFESIKQIKSVGTNKKRVIKYLINIQQKRTYVTSQSSCSQFNEWLSGLIEGDGKFFVSKKVMRTLKL